MSLALPARREVILVNAEQCVDAMWLATIEMMGLQTANGQRVGSEKAL